MKMRVYSLKTFAGLTVLSVILGVVVVEFAYLGLDALYPYASTSSGGQGAGGVGVPWGELTLTAFAVSPSDVEVTLSFVNYRIISYRDLKIYIACRSCGHPEHHMAGLPEGFELVSGSIAWNGSDNTPEVNLEAKIRAVKDGVWALGGTATRYDGSIGTLPLEITVSGGKVTDIRKVEPEFIEPVPAGPLTSLNNTSATIIRA